MQAKNVNFPNFDWGPDGVNTPTPGQVPKSVQRGVVKKILIALSLLGGGYALKAPAGSLVNDVENGEVPNLRRILVNMGADVKEMLGVSPSGISDLKKKISTLNEKESSDTNRSTYDNFLDIADIVTEAEKMGRENGSTAADNVARADINPKHLAKEVAMLLRNIYKDAEDRVSAPGTKMYVVAGLQQPIADALEFDLEKDAGITKAKKEEMLLRDMQECLRKWDPALGEFVTSPPYQPFVRDLTMLVRESDDPVASMHIVLNQNGFASLNGAVRERLAQDIVILCGEFKVQYRLPAQPPKPGAEQITQK